MIQGLRQTLAAPICRLLVCEVHPKFLPAEVKIETILDFLKSLGFGHIDIYSRKNESHIVAYKTKI